MKAIAFLRSHIEHIFSVLILTAALFKESEILHVKYWYQSEQTWMYMPIDLPGRLRDATISGHLAYLLPILAAFPGMVKLYQLKQNGTYYPYMVRCGKIKYSAMLVKKSMLSGALVMLTAIAIFTIYAVAYVVFHDGAEITFNGAGWWGNEKYQEPLFYYNLVKAGNGWITYLIEALFLMGFCAVWAGLGCVLIFVYRSKWVALSGVLLFYDTFILLCSAFDKLWNFSPTNLLLNGIVPGLPLGGIWYLPIYIVVSMLLYFVVLLFCFRRK